MSFRPNKDTRVTRIFLYAHGNQAPRLPIDSVFGVISVFLKVLNPFYSHR